MYIDNVDAAYLERRLEQELEQVECATNHCARLAHQAMVAGYRRRLTKLLRRAPDQQRKTLTLTLPKGGTDLPASFGR